ncbi:MAG: cyclic nucleotide-binding domain-containing protein [Alphaproteobacteria bacterium]|nr:cyclic nucleotide-binding domain-containing protein [Alphaproteobacteria bacterium]
MSLLQDVEVLRNIPLFAKMEPSKLKLLAFTAERLTFQPGQFLVKQGDAGDSAYVIVEGEADVQVDAPTGTITVAHIGRHAFVGEIAILCDVPRTASVRAATPLTAMRITKALFFELVNQFPSIAVEIMRELASRLSRTTQQLQQTLSQIESGKK